MNSDTMISKLTSKKSPMLRLLLSIKYSLPKSEVFYIFITVFKLLGVLIIVNDFQSADRVSPKNISYILSNFSSFSIFSSIKYQAYTMISFIILGIVLLFIGFVIVLYNNFKLNQNFMFTKKSVILVNTVSYMSIFLTMFAQHFIELLSFIFYINVNDKTTLELFQKRNDFIIMIINIFSIIFFNVLVYVCYFIYNLPYNVKDNPFKVKIDKLTLFIFMF